MMITNGNVNSNNSNTSASSLLLILSKRQRLTLWGKCTVVAACYLIISSCLEAGGLKSYLYASINGNDEINSTTTAATATATRHLSNEGTTSSSTNTDNNNNNLNNDLSSLHRHRQAQKAIEGLERFSKTKENEWIFDADDTTTRDHAAFVIGNYTPEYPLTDFLDGPAAPYYDLQKQELVFPFANETEEALCQFQSRIKGSHHFPHSMQQLYRCFDWWFSQKHQKPVLLVSESSNYGAPFPPNPYVEGYVQVLQDVFGVEVRKTSSQLRDKSVYVKTEGGGGVGSPHQTGAQVVSSSSEMTSTTRPRLFYQSHSVEVAETLRQKTSQFYHFGNGNKEPVMMLDSIGAATSSDQPPGCPAVTTGGTTTKRYPIIGFLNRQSSSGRRITKPKVLLEAIEDYFFIKKALEQQHHDDDAKNNGNNNNNNIDNIPFDNIPQVSNIVHLNSFDGMDYLEQAKWMSQIDILISPHGAQLTSVAFLPKCGGLLELFPKGYWLPDFFGTLAAASGHSHVALYTGSWSNRTEDRLDFLNTSATTSVDGGSSGGGDIKRRNKIRGRGIKLMEPKIVALAVDELVQQWQTCCDRASTGASSTSSSTSSTSSASSSSSSQQEQQQEMESKSNEASLAQQQRRRTTKTVERSLAIKTQVSSYHHHSTESDDTSSRKDSKGSASRAQQHIDETAEQPQSREDEGRRRQIQAAEALERFHKERIFDTVGGRLSNHEYVLEHGFLRMWEPCALERIFQRKRSKQQRKEKVTISFLGGSSTAMGGGVACRDYPKRGTILSDRYTNQLQQRFDKETSTTSSYRGGHGHDLLQFQTINLGQGSSKSTHSALVIDSLVDATETDVIVWEYLQNDGSKHHPHEDMRQKLDFWLRRIQIHYARVGKPPPLILLVFLWDNETYHIDEKPMEIYGSTISRFVELGWDIAAINVGGSVNQTNVLNNFRLLGRDTQHPGCNGVRLIAKMLQYVFYSNLAAPGNDGAGGGNTQYCGTSSLIQPAVETRTTNWLPPQLPLYKQFPSQYVELWTDLFREDTYTGAITAWEPKYYNQEEQPITNLATVPNIRDIFQQWGPTITLATADRGRADRKNAFVISHCRQQEESEPSSSSSSEKGQRGITILDPNLKWLGLSVSVGDNDWAGKDSSWALDVYVNDVLIEPIRGNKWNPGGYTFINNWVNLRPQQQQVQPQEGTDDDSPPLVVPRRVVSDHDHNAQQQEYGYHVRFCVRGKKTSSSFGSEAYLSTIVGVSVPEVLESRKNIQALAE